MQAEDFLFEKSCKRESIKSLVDSLVNRIRVVDIFSQTECAFLRKSKKFIDSTFFMRSSN